MVCLQMFRPKQLAYALGIWSCGAVCGPHFGPLLGGFAFQRNGWQWPLWYVVPLSHFVARVEFRLDCPKLHGS